MSPYRDLWSNWSDVQGDFDMKQAEPDEVLIAQYNYEDYSGEAYVVYRVGDKYYVVEGGHCSCYGLEGQWAPEEYTKDLLIAALNKARRDKWQDEVLAKLQS